MANTAATFPGTVADDASIGTQIWTNPGNAASDNGVYATCITGLAYSENSYGAKILLAGTASGNYKTNTLDTTLRAGAYGGSTDLWGCTITAADVNNSGFGIGYICNGSSPSHRLKATNFGFSIPTGATINGVLATIERQITGVGPFTNNVDYIKIVVYYTEAAASVAIPALANYYNQLRGN